MVAAAAHTRSDLDAHEDLFDVFDLIRLIRHAAWNEPVPHDDRLRAAGPGVRGASPLRFSAVFAVRLLATALPTVGAALVAALSVP